MREVRSSCQLNKTCLSHPLKWRQQKLSEFGSKRCVLMCTYSQDSQHLLWFNVHGQTYQFKALQFSLATAPLDFTRVVKEGKLILWSRIIQGHRYLDNWWLGVRKRHQCLVQTKKLVQRLGFVIKFWKRSKLKSTQDWLSRLPLHFGTRKVLSNTKQMKRPKKSIQDMEISSETVPRLLMSLIGVLASLEKAIPICQLHIRPLQWYLKTNCQYSQSIDLSISVPNLLKKHLQWWKILKIGI